MRSSDAQHFNFCVRNNFLAQNTQFFVLMKTLKADIFSSRRAVQDIGLIEREFFAFIWSATGIFFFKIFHYIKQASRTKFVKKGHVSFVSKLNMHNLLCINYKCF